MSIVEKCDEGQENLEQMIKKCRSDVIIEQVKYYMTGYFSCHYSNQTATVSKLNAANHNMAWMDRIYVFVNGISILLAIQILILMHYSNLNIDPENLVVPYENIKDYLFIAVFQSHPAIIPCRPTYSYAEVTLWKLHTTLPEQIKENTSLGITYDPKKGFYFDHPRWNSDAVILECRFEVKSIQAEAKSTINLHWSSKFLLNNDE